MKRGRKILGAVLVLLLVFGGIAAAFVWQRSQDFTAPQAQTKPGNPGVAGPSMAASVEAVPVRTGMVSVDVRAVGTLLANESVVVRPEIAGRITAIHFKEGQPVARGIDLVTMDASELSAQLAESIAAVRLNKLSFNRAKDLSQKKLISRQDYDQAQANLTESEARQSLSEARLSKTVLRAPFAGIVGLRLVSPGDYVEAGKDIVNLEDIDSLKLDFRIPEVYLAKGKVGQPVEVRVDAFPDTPFGGNIYAIDPRIDETTRTLELRARIPNPDGRLRPGMFARVTLSLEQHPNALLIPEQALVPEGGERFVYRVVDGKAAMQKVQIGERRVGEVEVIEGLHPNDTVITAGQIKLHDGAPVKVIEAADGKAQQPTAPS